MVDLETLGLEDNAILPEIGIVSFNENFVILEKMSWRPDPLQQLLSGRTTTQSTIDWWLNQDIEVREKVLFSPYEECKLVAHQIQNWLHSFVNRRSIYWTGSIKFDLKKLDTFLKDFGEPHASSLFHYRNIRDYRTVRETYASLHPVKYDEMKMYLEKELRDLVFHRAVDDCIWQIKLLELMLEDMK